MILNIISKTEKGKEALKKHIKETSYSRIDPRRLVMEKIFTQNIIEKEPFTLQLKFKVFIENNHWLNGAKEEIEKGLLKNGAEAEKDYLIEVN